MTALPSITAPDRRAERLPGLDLLRVAASTLVVYTHAATWLAYRHVDWLPAQVVDYAVGDAFRLNPSLSFLGVATFLVVSGLVVTHAASRERPGQFLWRRISRIAPLLLVATALAWVLVDLGVLDVVQGARPGFGDLVQELTMVNYFANPVAPPLAVTWTLLVQVVFYLYVSATIPVLRRHPWLPPAAAATLVAVALSFTTDSSSTAWQRVAMIAAYFPVLCIGQVISLVRTGRVPAVAGTAIGFAHFLLFVWADRLGPFSFQGGSDSRTLALVVLVVVATMTARGRVTTSRTVGAWSARTYSIYLVHTTCMYPVLDALAPRLGPTLALVPALLLVAVVSEVLHRFVELPTNRWLRGRRKSPHPPAGVVR